MAVNLDPIIIDWIMIPSRDFHSTVQFFENVLAFPAQECGTPVHDLQFLRYAMFTMPNGVVLEVVEPDPTCAAYYVHPVVALTVKSLKGMRKRLEHHGIEFFTETFGGPSSWTWTYFLDPEGTTFQLNADSASNSQKSITPSSEGVEWILLPSRDFDSMLVHLQEVMGFTLEQRGTPVDDLQFLRYAVFRASNGVVLELVEPSLECLERYTHPVITITVRDLKSTFTRLQHHGIEIITDVIDTGSGLGWFYFYLPGASIFQIQGAYHPETTQA